MSSYRLLWILWLAYFAAVETRALMNPGRGDTLSEFVWMLIFVHPLVRYLFAGFLAWLAVHILSGGKLA